MGSHPNINYNKFPQQGSFFNLRVKVCFNYDSSKRIYGTVVRDDVDEPNKMIIRLDDGRYILSTECQCSPITSKE